MKSFRINIENSATDYTLRKVERILSELSTIEGVVVDKENLEIIYGTEQEGVIGEIMDKHMPL